MMTNLRGFGNRTGQKAKQMTKQAKAPRLQAPKINKRSHRLTRSGIPRSAASRQESPCSSSGYDGKMRDGKKAEEHVHVPTNETLLCQIPAHVLHCGRVR